ncbi:PKD domain-containing protein [Streptomyces sp. NPDC059851]|uniref:PKD domain-containing protein n=1 Tax=Streptomyces sp. NPDC059851 TaxID=3346971 RepID=UPI003648EDF0
MRPIRATAMLTAGLLGLLGLPATAAAAEAPAGLYVNNRDGSNCSDGGPGSQAVPYCTISAAAKVVQPGQTVRIKAENTYDEAVTIDRSGEPGKPITFEVDPVPQFSGAWLAKTLTISGASHVAVRGLSIRGVQVSRSTDVELEQIDAGRGLLDSVVVGEGSTDVRVIRSRMSGARIEGGSRGTVLSRNMIGSAPRPAVTVVDAPGTVVTNNTISGYCGATVSVGGSSTGSALFNNVIYTEATSARCQSAEARNGTAVSQSATGGTRVDYNVIVGHAALSAAYSWAGTAYKDPAAFATATGQGAHDILAPSRDDVSQMVGSPTIDSGDPTAPGVVPADFDGHRIADDPRVPNTGKNGGHIDRGAHETHDYLGNVWTAIDHTWAPVGTSVQVQAVSDSHWPTAMSYRIDFGDGTAPVTTRQGTAAHGLATHVYNSPCECTVKVTAVNDAGHEVSTQQAVKVTPAGPLTAGFTTEPVLPTSTNQIGGPKPLTVDVDTRTATAAPWPVEGVDVDFGDGTSEHRDRLDTFRHTYSRPGDHKVTVTVRDSKDATSTVSRNVKVDYAPSGYVATAPFRVLDTRTTGTAVQGGSPLPVTMPVGLSVPDHVHSGGMAAAVLNVTVTGASEDTHLSVWPSGQPRPVASNVNVRAGGTSSNTVTVPVGADGKVQAQLNSGRASLIVDFVGYYQPGAGEWFTPLAPTRLADTRTAGGALAGGQTRTVKVAGTGGVPADATAVALNLTGTGSTADAHVIAYPDPANRPATSNLNVEPGKDKSNQVLVPVGPGGTITLYTNTGSTHLVLDAVGWYGKGGRALFTPAVPKRLADTRATGKLAPGATTTVAGLPAGAVGAVLNVTATESTGPGFLTAYGYGTVRPEASSLNTRPGDTVPNHVTTPAASGRISIWNSWGGSTHVITDLLGYFTQP